MNIKLVILKKSTFPFKDKTYYRLSVNGEGLSYDFYTTEKIYNIAEELKEYEAKLSVKPIKDSFGKNKLCLDKIIYLKAV